MSFTEKVINSKYLPVLLPIALFVAVICGKVITLLLTILGIAMFLSILLIVQEEKLTKRMDLPKKRTERMVIYTLAIFAVCLLTPLVWIDQKLHIKDGTENFRISFNKKIWIRRKDVVYNFRRIVALIRCLFLHHMVIYEDKKIKRFGVDFYLENCMHNPQLTLSCRRGETKKYMPPEEMFKYEMETGFITGHFASVGEDYVEIGIDFHERNTKKQCEKEPVANEMYSNLKVKEK